MPRSRDGSPTERRRDGTLAVLLVTSDKYPPFRPAAKAIFGLGLPARGHTVDWLLQAEDRDVPSGAIAGPAGTAYVAATTNADSRLGRLWKYWLDLRNDCRVFGLLRRRDYSLVQIKDKYVGALPVLLAAKRRGVPVFYWLAYPHAEASLHAARERVARYTLLYALRGYLQRWLLYRVILPSCAHVFVQSEQMRLDVAREGIPPESTTAVPSSVDLSEFRRVLSESAGTDGAPLPQPGVPTIVYLGTLLRERQLDLLVRMMRLVLARVPDAQLMLIGRGEMPEDEAHLMAEAERLGVSSHVKITGWLPAEQAWRLCLAAQVCVSPYRPIPILRSTSPTKLIEYMALGKAVVANDHPEQSQVLMASGAGLICGWSEAEFAEAVVTLLENPALREPMGRRGREFVERHRTYAVLTESVLCRYLAVLDGLAVAKPRPTAADVSSSMRE